MPAATDTLAYLLLQDPHQYVRLMCQACRKPVDKRLDEISVVWGERRTWAWVQARAKCRKCGAPVDGSRVTLELVTHAELRRTALLTKWGGFPSGPDPEDNPFG